MESDPRGEKPTDNSEQRIDVGIKGKITLTMEDKTGGEKHEKETSNPTNPAEKKAWYRRFGSWIRNDPNAFIVMMATVVIALFTAEVWCIAEQQASDARAVQRAFVFLDKFEVARQLNSAGEVVGFIFSSTWKNSGVTPTKNLIMHFNSGYPPDKADDLSDKAPCDPIHLVLGPQATASGLPLYVPVEVVATAISAPPTGFTRFWGWASYWDVFGKKHISKYCYAVVGALGDIRSRAQPPSISFVRL